MVLSGFIGRRNISGLALDIQLPEEVYASVGAMLKVTLRNNRRFVPAFLIIIRIGGQKVIFPYIEPGRALSRYIEITFQRRGLQRLDDVLVCSVFPFNFFMRCRIIDDLDVIVFPEPKDYGFLEYESGVRREKGEEMTEERGYEGDLLSLRDYITGDPIKYIHWKASAKTDRLKTKELSALMAIPRVIDIERLKGRDLEERLSYGTYLVLRYSKMGIPFFVRIKGRVFNLQREGRSSKKREVLREFALY